MKKFQKINSEKQLQLMDFFKFNVQESKIKKKAG